MPLSIAQFFDRLRDSKVLDAEEVEALATRFPSNKLWQDSDGLVRELVAAGALTEYQMQALISGGWRSLVLGDYVVLNKIGEGGMGRVFQARHRLMKRQVAVKVLAPAVTENPGAIKRFQREMQAAAKLSHPNIVASYDAREQDGIHYLVMEYVAGDDLERHVKKYGALDARAALDYTMQTAVGLAYAHQQGVIHRDIKPANLLLDPLGTIKILDMGLARIDEPLFADSDGLTKSGSLMGTADYMAPEQALNTKTADARADIYSLGCTLYYLLMARPIYEGETCMHRILAHREQPIPSLAAQGSGLSSELDATFRRMVAKRPQDRFQDMGEVQAALWALQPKETAFSATSSQPSPWASPSGDGGHNLAATAPCPSGTAQFSAPGSNSGSRAVAAPTNSKSSGNTTHFETQRQDDSRSIPTARPPHERLSGARTSSERKPGPRVGRLAAGFCGVGAILALALLIFILAWNGDWWNAAGRKTSGLPNAKHQKPTPEPSLKDKSEKKNTERPVVSRFAELANSSRVEAEAAQSAWLYGGGGLPEDFLPTEAAEALVQWNAAEQAMASQEHQTAQEKYKLASRLYRVALQKNRETSLLLAAVQKGLKELTARRQSWRELSQGMAASKLPKVAGQAELIFQAAQESAGRLESLALVPQQIADATVLYDKAELEYQANPKETRPSEFENSLRMKFVYISPGEFEMGSPDSEKNRDRNEQLHRVRVASGFYLGIHEVTVAQFREFVRQANHKTDAETDGMGGWGWNNQAEKFEQKLEYHWGHTGFTQGEEHPVVNVSWNDANAFCQWLRGTKQAEGREYRLPTEVEWEYACRAGTKTAYASGDDPETLALVANVADSTANEKFPNWDLAIKARDGHVFTAGVGRFQSNAFGLFDMHGNVWEWCSDWHDYPPVVDVAGGFSEGDRVARGGGWSYDPTRSRSACRRKYSSGFRDYVTGFRVAFSKSP